MGEVWRAFDLRLERWVAIKGARQEGASEDRLVREARLMARMHHPSLVQIYDLVHGQSPEGSEGERAAWWLVMELVEGVTLTERVRTEGPMDIDAVIELGASLAGGLTEAHAYGMVHRDLSGGNVILTARGAAKIVDFGIARPVRRHPARGEDFETDRGVVLGTPGFIAPERLEGVVGDLRTDLYGLGAVLYLAVTARRVHEDDGEQGKPPRRLLRRALARPAPDPRALRLDCPPALARSIRRLLSRDPAERFQSAEALLKVLESVERKRPEPAASSPPLRAGRFGVDGRALWLALAGAAAIGAAAALWVV